MARYWGLRSSELHHRARILYKPSLIDSCRVAGLVVDVGADPDRDDLLACIAKFSRGLGERQPALVGAIGDDGHGVCRRDAIQTYRGPKSSDVLGRM